MAKRGPKEKYKPEYHLQIIKLAAKAGMINEEIAKECGIVASTLYEWQNKYPEVAKALEDGKEVVDKKVEDSLLKRALGYEYKEKEVKVGSTGKPMHVKEVTKHIAPDTTAQIFWLKNRKPKDWRDRQEIDQTIANKDDKPFKTELSEDDKKLLERVAKRLDVDE